MTRAQQHFHDTLPKCPGCGRGHIYDEDIAQEMYEREKQAEEGIGAVLFQGLKRLTFWCNECHCKSDDARKTAFEKQRRDRLEEDTYAGQWLPMEARGHTWDSVDNSLAGDNIKHYRGYGRRMLLSNLWVQGTRGVGKTYFAHCMAHEYLSRLRTVALAEAWQVMELASLRVDTPRRERSISKWENCDLFILDDVDKARWTRQGLDLLWRVVNRRKAKNLAHLITSQYDRVAMNEAWLQASDNNPTIVSSIFSRLMPINAIEMTGPDIRMMEKQLPIEERFEEEDVPF